MGGERCGVRVGDTSDEAHEQEALAGGDGHAGVIDAAAVSDRRAARQADRAARRLKVRAAALEVGRLVEQNVEGEERAVLVQLEASLLALGCRVA